MAQPSTPRARIAGFARNASGLSMLEFALAMPLLFGTASFGIELANLCLCHLRVSQYALDVADNVSRVDQDQNLYEYDINDALTGVYLEGLDMGLTKQGRVLLTAVDWLKDPNNPTAPARQYIHWQRCIGARADFSTPSLKVDYTQGTDPAKMGVQSDTGYTTLDPTSPTTVTAPNGSGAIVAEIWYQYKPIFGSLYFSDANPKILKYTAAFSIRNDRYLAKIYNSPVQPYSRCGAPFASETPPKAVS